MENREQKAERLVRESGKEIHSNTCATSRAPARDPGPCDCSVQHETKTNLDQLLTSVVASI